MSVFTRFDSNLDIRYDMEASKILKDDYWRLLKPFTYYIGSLPSDKYVVVPEGYLSDGASTPFFVRSLLPKMGRYSQAAFLHDWLCEHYYYLEKNHSPEFTQCVWINRKEIDRIFYEALKVLEVPSWRRFVIKAGLEVWRLFVDREQPKRNELKMKLEREYLDKK